MPGDGGGGHGGGDELGAGAAALAALEVAVAGRGAGCHGLLARRVPITRAGWKWIIGFHGPHECGYYEHP